MSHECKGAAGDPRFAWFTEARFGLFIHWGLFSLLEGRWKGKDVDGIAECIQGQAQIPVAEYEPLAKQFNPAKFDAEKWVQLAKATGMKYLCITSKHCDGFAMFNSTASDYNVVKASPFKRDVVAELAAACKKHGLVFCLYYSQVGDWHEPNGIGNSWDFGPDSEKDFQQFLDDKVKPQLTEILTQYGRIGMVWMDVPSHITLEQSQELADLVHAIQPGCLINSRIGHGVGDYMSAPDNGIPAAGFGRPWETPATLNETWGFKRSDTGWKTPAKLIFNLVDIVSKGGNYLLNIGPKGDGTIPGASVRCLQEVGKWMARHAESIHGAGESPLPRQFIHPFGRCTAKADRLFLHVMKWPAENTLFVPGIVGDPKAVYLLADPDKTPIPHRRVGDADITFTLDPAALPLAAMDPVDTVVVIEFAGPAVLDTRPLVLPDAATTLNTFEATLTGDGLEYVDNVWDASIATTETWAEGADVWAKVPEPTRYATITSVVGWRRADQTVAWPIRVKEAGRYELLVTYAAGPESAGNAARVTIGKQSYDLPINPGPTWYDYKTAKLAPVNLPAGGSTVTVAAAKLAGPWLMSFKNVRVQPVGYVEIANVAESDYTVRY